MAKAYGPLDRSSRFPDQRLLEKEFREWLEFERILADLGRLGEIHHLGQTQNDKYQMPLIGMSFGSKDPSAPVLALFGGVHGLERIGSQVVLSLMQNFGETLLWDGILQETVRKFRLLFFPIINPLGILLKTRSNPRGVDLMRNAPVEAVEKPNFFLGGHYLSPKLPWYRGHQGLEPESKAVLEFCEKQFFQSEAVITVDFHSGFGVQDQIWFPYAKTREPFPHLAEADALIESFEKSHPHHFYKIEPQALNYTTNGDLWDYIYDEFRGQSPKVYLPLALEMGSWIWMKKNPLQVFSSLGAFNPMRPHRHKRVLRRHLTFFEFLIRATVSNKHWAALSPEQKNKFRHRALKRWYS